MKEANLDDLKGAGLPEKVAKTYKKHYKINKFQNGHENYSHAQKV